VETLKSARRDTQAVPAASEGQEAPLRSQKSLRQQSVPLRLYRTEAAVDEICVVGDEESGQFLRRLK
jgi:hypothetical protein